MMNANEVEQLRQAARAKYKCEISRYYLIRSLEVTYSALELWKRNFALRVDLRFANDYPGGDLDSPNCFQDADHKVITRFNGSLKSQLREEHWRNGRRGKPSLPKYIWVREQDSGQRPHYHIVLFFNKDVYAFLGNYTDRDARNMATRIQQAWCSALRLPFPEYAQLVHFPSNPAYVFDRKSAAVHSPTYWEFLLRIAYLCKVRTKPLGDEKHNFGCSQAERVRAPANGIVLGI